MQDSEKLIYHGIITKCWIAFSKGRPYPEFSDEWWDGVIGDFNAIIKEYKGTDYSPLVETLSMQMLNQHERRQKEWKMQ